MPPFSTSLETILFASLIVLWIMLEIIGGGIIPVLRGRGRLAKRKGDPSNLLLRGALYASIITAFLLAFNRVAVLPEWLFYPGIILMILGILVRQWAMLALGRFFTLTIGVQQNQRVVDYGPYRFVRHPSYLGMSMIAIGTGVALQSWGGVLVILALYGFALGYRIRVEEKVLAAELGDEYIRYMRRTKRLIPFVL